ncbi:uncharacterized protein V1516DRAFT_673579 [Lipomyces oligophaga]|uniref:uncharacterized protein n=1 Tax=Lipomyces oligophaga TaxID=45792 RepID=UPI0034D01DFC
MAESLESSFASLRADEVLAMKRSDTPVTDDETPNLKPGMSTIAPRLLHKWRLDKSILSLASSHSYVFAGTEAHEIIVFDINTFQQVDVLQGHGGSVLCLCVSTDKSLLFSGGSDSIMKIWAIDTLEELYTVYSVFDIGDIFTIIYSQHLQTVFFGSQNASIQWCDLPTIDRHTPLDKSGMPSNRFSKFFNSSGPGGQKVQTTSGAHLSVANTLIELPEHNMMSYAHNGFVYTLLIYRSATQISGATVAESKETILSGGGDGVVNWWVMRQGRLHKIQTFATQASILCLASLDTFLYCGMTEGKIGIWDLDTCQAIRVIQAHKSDTLSIATFGHCIFSGSTTGYIRKWSRELQMSARWKCHDGLILSTIGLQALNCSLLITGGNDGDIAIWDITDAFPSSNLNFSFANDQLLASLSTFISFRTISGSSEAEYRTECRRCASYLKKLFKNFGASAELLTTEENCNPVVCGKFTANSTDNTGTTVLFYGHYDVIAAAAADKWETDPYSLAGINGYLYGRGVSDNKGPILAAIFAAAELFQAKQLKTNVIFLIEGEEENGSRAFESTVVTNKGIMGVDKCDWILLSNSYWLDDDVPCLNYGMRGVIYLTVEIHSDHPDLHSGVDGGSYREPLMDMAKLLATLTDENERMLVPKFYEPVHPVTETELALYEQIRKSSSVSISSDLLMARWRMPSLTVHGITVSGPANQTIIPRTATATLSVRTVPDQDTQTISSSLQAYLCMQFEILHSHNHIVLKINRQADPWLGDPSNKAFTTLARCVKDTWGRDPLYIREGGTIPAVRFLEKVFDAPAAHLPCGQASDHAHLDNERIRIVNLYNAKSIWKQTFNNLPPRED